MNAVPTLLRGFPRFELPSSRIVLAAEKEEGQAFKQSTRYQAGLIQKSATRETPNELNEVVNSSRQQSSDFEREEQK